jgi:hypothetical protein
MAGPRTLVELGDGTKCVRDRMELPAEACVVGYEGVTR